MNNSKHAAMMEKRQEIMQQKQEAGSIGSCFPDVANIAKIHKRKLNAAK